MVASLFVVVILNEAIVLKNVPVKFDAENPLEVSVTLETPAVTEFGFAMTKVITVSEPVGML